MGVIGYSLALVHVKYWRVRDEAGIGVISWYRGNVETEADNKCDRVHENRPYLPNTPTIFSCLSLFLCALYNICKFY